jgi:hypothetical protein
LKWGTELRDGAANYVHDAEATFPNPITFQGTTRTGVDTDFDTRVSGQQRALYASYVGRWAAPLTVELGMRWDEQTYTNQSELSPRANLLFDLGPRRQGSGGRFFSGAGYRRAADQRHVALFPRRRRSTRAEPEHRFSGLRLQAERTRSSSTGRALRESFTATDLLPERSRIASGSTEPRRVRGDEFAAAAAATPGSGGRVVRSSVEDQLDGADVPRSWDQPWRSLRPDPHRRALTMSPQPAITKAG